MVMGRRGSASLSIFLFVVTKFLCLPKRSTGGCGGYIGKHVGVWQVPETPCCDREGGEHQRVGLSLSHMMLCLR